MTARAARDHKNKAMLRGGSNPVVCAFTFVAVSCGARTGLLSNTDQGVGVPGASGGVLSTVDGGSERQRAERRWFERLQPRGGSSVPIFAIDDAHTLLRFSPLEARFTVVGRVDCEPDAGTSWSAFAVDRTGLGYLYFVEADGGYVYHLDTQTAACSPTPAILQQPPRIVPNGMAFVGTPDGNGEVLNALVLPETDPLSTNASDITYHASINPGTFGITMINWTAPDDLNPTPLCARDLEWCAGVNQVFGSGAGSLLQAIPGGGSTRLSTTIEQVDTRARKWVINLGEHYPLSAVVSWGGDIYLFDGDTTSTNAGVLRFCRRDGSLSEIATWPRTVFLAAVQTMAPTQ